MLTFYIHNVAMCCEIGKTVSIRHSTKFVIGEN